MRVIVIDMLSVNQLILFVLCLLYVSFLYQPDIMFEYITKKSSQSVMKTTEHNITSYSMLQVEEEDEEEEGKENKSFVADILLFVAITSAPSLARLRTAAR